ncbi:MAG: hypothetical protein A2289_19645 [Deltaproteobacteria bacterium RIFOXYA12_FULL_58_15]|nr:MAG: hypothetical protein A2289_19645 [Deltaproteobacteria bacterium RIFOXYA12_FULL_58_15]
MYERFDRIVPGFVAKANFVIDIILVLLVLSMATSGSNRVAGLGFWLTGLLSISSWILSATALRLYSPCTPRSWIDSMAMGTLAVVATTGVTFIADFVLHGGEPVVDVLGFGLMFLGVENLIRILIIDSLEARYPGAPDMVLVVGTGPVGAAVAKHLAEYSRRREVMGFLDFSGESTTSPDGRLPVFGNATALLTVLREHPVGEVYIAGQITTQSHEMQAVVRLCEEIGMPFAVPLSTLDYERATPFPSPAPDDFVHYVTVRSKPTQHAIKRLIDIFASTCALVIMSPLLVGLAAAIKLNTAGPVLFRQRRVGLHGYSFNMLKFRSMVANAEVLQAQLSSANEQAGPVFKMRNDPRMTRVGRFIRKYSIDELPQLINILRGDMTIVGPRPALPAEVEQYSAWQRRRLSMRPGLTCFWQVGGRNEVSFDEWMQLDLKYIDNWNLAIDARLIVMTVPAVLWGSGAS